MTSWRDREQIDIYRSESDKRKHCTLYFSKSSEMLVDNYGDIYDVKSDEYIGVKILNLGIYFEKDGMGEDITNVYKEELYLGTNSITKLLSIRATGEPGNYALIFCHSGKVIAEFSITYDGKTRTTAGALSTGCIQQPCPQPKPKDTQGMLSTGCDTGVCNDCKQRPWRNKLSAQWNFCDKIQWENDYRKWSTNPESPFYNPPASGTRPYPLNREGGVKELPKSGMLFTGSGIGSGNKGKMCGCCSRDRHGCSTRKLFN